MSNPAPAPGRAQRGLTLVELLIVLAVLGLLFGVALPSFGSARDAAYATQAKAALLASLTTAANRAAVAGRHAVLCPSFDGETCAGGSDWSSGWIGFLDLDGNRLREAGEMLFERAPALPDRVRLTTTSGRPRIVFQPNGGNAGSNATFTLCDGRGRAQAMTLVLSNTGRLRWGEAKDAAAALTCTS